MYITGLGGTQACMSPRKEKVMSKKVVSKKSKKSKATESTNNSMEEKIMDQNLENEIAEVVDDYTGPETHLSHLPTVQEEEPKTPPKAKKPRATRVYKLGIGKLPEANQKPLGEHAVVITEAITDLVNEGKETATRDEIMAKAVEKGLFDRKPSRQGVVPIFSWWRKPLSGLGWLSQNEVETPVKEEKADLPVEENPADDAAM